MKLLMVLHGYAINGQMYMKNPVTLQIHISDAFTYTSEML